LNSSLQQSYEFTPNSVFYVDGSFTPNGNQLSAIDIQDNTYYELTIDTQSQTRIKTDTGSLPQSNFSLIVTNSVGLTDIAPNALTVTTGVTPLVTSASPLSATEGDEIYWYGSNFGEQTGIALLDCYCLTISDWTNTSGYGEIPGGIYPGEKHLIIVNTDFKSTAYSEPITIYIPEVSADNYYYPRTIENVTKKFIDLFNGLKIKKYSSSGTILKTTGVPVMWGPMDKYFMIRKEGYNSGNDPYYQKVPRISIYGPMLTFSSNRQSSSNTARQHYSENLGLDNITDFYEDIQPRAYDYGYVVTIRTNKMDDMNQILENILPYYEPSRYLRVKEFSFLNIERDLKVTFDGNASPEFGDPYEENTNRIIECTLNFTVDGFMYMPVSTSKIIKIIDSKYFVDTIGNFTSATAVEDNNFVTSGYKDDSYAPSSDSWDVSAYDATTGTYSYKDLNGER